jgi:hypothetical protein
MCLVGGPQNLMGCRHCGSGVKLFISMEISTVLLLPTLEKGGGARKIEWGSSDGGTKTTALGIPVWSPTMVLTERHSG